MSDAILLTDRVRTAIRLGESHFREFKSGLEGPPGQKSPRDRKDIAKDISSTLVGFANADGGELIVGVEDNGEITGLVGNIAFFSYLQNSWKDGVHKDCPLQNVKIAHLRIDGLEILYFSILRSSTHIHQKSDGKCLQRRDLETVPISVAELTFTRQERVSQEYDRQFVEGPQADALDLDAVRILADQISVGMSPEKCLQYLDLADFGNGFLRLRRAALLLFARDSAKWHPRLQIRILRVSGTELRSGPDYNVASDRYVQGNIVSILEKAWDTLRPDLVQTRLSGTARFETRVMYPEFACREALINAVAHRDYSREGLGIEIYIFDNRMEVTSPGGLLSSLSIDDLRRLEGAHQSRNALVSRVLREIGYMREVGEGMRRIFELMRSNELAEPEIASEAGSFTVKLRNTPLYRPEHVIWLDAFSAFDLSREQKAIIVLGYGGKHVSPNEIWRELGIVDTEHYRKLVHSLQKMGILDTVIQKKKAQNIARASGINIRDIPRFNIKLPNVPDARVQSTEVDVPASIKREIESDPLPRVFVGNVPYNIDKRSIIEFIRSLGVDCDIVFPRNSAGFVFLQLNGEVTADEAKGKIDGVSFMGKTLVARDAHPRQSAAKTPVGPL